MAVKIRLAKRWFKKDLTIELWLLILERSRWKMPLQKELDPLILFYQKDHEDRVKLDIDRIKNGYQREQNQQIGLQDFRC